MSGGSGLVPPPRQVTGADGPWEPVRADLDRHGVALVHSRLADWPAPPGGESELRRQLGRDWTRYRELAGRPHADRFRATRMLIKHVAATAVGAHPHELELAYGLTGRLYVRGCDQIDLNLSHTKGIALVGVTSLGLIGVDLEHEERRVYGSGIEPAMCTPDELRRLAHAPEPERNLQLLRRWTLKEAYTKALGQGLLFPFRHFGVDLPDSCGRARLLRPDGDPVNEQGWTFHTRRLADGYLAGVAVRDDGRGRTPDTGLATALDRNTVQVLRERQAAARRPPGGD
ncbi:4'-phosphopantetheinyl transferase family protein [Kitasatospora sp. NPDC092948]|uniref:4'-phosphopantetheinyl transferase family protein n=1 Tax=Kitasatospora sp. NPDC092948 TaxID=3364088 RepID=UPI003826D90D